MRSRLSWLGVPLIICALLIFFLLSILLFLGRASGPQLDTRVDEALKFAKDACLADPVDDDQTAVIDAGAEARLEEFLHGKVAISRHQMTVILDRAIPPTDRASQLDKMRQCIKERIIDYFNFAYPFRERATPPAPSPSPLPRSGATGGSVIRQPSPGITPPPHTAVATSKLPPVHIATVNCGRFEDGPHVATRECISAGPGTWTIRTALTTSDTPSTSYTISGRLDGVYCGKARLDGTTANAQFECRATTGAAGRLELLVSPTDAAGFDAANVPLAIDVTRSY